MSGTLLQPLQASEDSLLLTPLFQLNPNPGKTLWSTTSSQHTNFTKLQAVLMLINSLFGQEKMCFIYVHLSCCLFYRSSPSFYKDPPATAGFLGSLFAPCSWPGWQYHTDYINCKAFQCLPHSASLYAFIQKIYFLS